MLNLNQNLYIPRKILLSRLTESDIDKLHVADTLKLFQEFRKEPNHENLVSLLKGTERVIEHDTDAGLVLLRFFFQTYKEKYSKVTVQVINYGTVAGGLFLPGRILHSSKKPSTYSVVLSSRKKSQNKKGDDTPSRPLQVINDIIINRSSEPSLKYSYYVVLFN